MKDPHEKNVSFYFDIEVYIDSKINQIPMHQLMQKKYAKAPTWPRSKRTQATISKCLTFVARASQMYDRLSDPSPVRSGQSIAVPPIRSQDQLSIMTL